MLSENIFFPNFKLFAPQYVFVTQIFAPNIYDKSTPLVSGNIDRLVSSLDQGEDNVEMSCVAVESDK